MRPRVCREKNIGDDGDYGSADQLTGLTAFEPTCWTAEEYTQTHARIGLLECTTSLSDEPIHTFFAPR